VPFPRFDRNKLILKPLAERKHDLDHANFYQLNSPIPEYQHVNLEPVSARIANAHRNGKPVILIMGAHVIRAGVGRMLIELMRRKIITHVAMNGAGPIHDYELALIGKTTESVARYIRSGEFGLWQETSEINSHIVKAAKDGLGLGEGLGRAIAEGDFPHKELSVLAAGYKLRVPVTSHIGVGYDIIHEHPNADGAALGATSYADFLVMAESVTKLEDGGVVLVMGSSVMGPEVFLKALSMARNVAHQEGKTIKSFTTAVFDLMELSGDLHQELPKTDPRYYFRPWKTLLVRTVADGGESFYLSGDHKVTFPNLYARVLAKLDGK